MGEMKAQLSWATLIGNVFKSVGGPITWASKRQKTVFISSTNAETKAIAKGVKESIWLCTLLGRMEGKHLLWQWKLNARFLQMKHFAVAMTVCLLCIVCSVGIQHGDISPEHVMRFVVANGEYDCILTDWGMLCWKRDIALLFLQSFLPHLLFTREGYALHLMQRA